MPSMTMLFVSEYQQTTENVVLKTPPEWTCNKIVIHAIDLAIKLS